MSLLAALAAAALATAQDPPRPTVELKDEEVRVSPGSCAEARENLDYNRGELAKLDAVIERRQAQGKAPSAKLSQARATRVSTITGWERIVARCHEVPHWADAPHVSSSKGKLRLNGAPVRAGERRMLAPGDQFCAGPDGEAMVTFSDGTHIRIAQNGCLRLGGSKGGASWREFLEEMRRRPRTRTWQMTHPFWTRG